MIELFHHSGKDHELLNIFLTKNGNIRLNDIEQFIHNKHNSFKKSRATSPIHEIIHSRNLNGEFLVAIAIHFFIRWRKNQSYLFICAKLYILLNLAGIRFKILIRAKLLWI